MIKFKYIQFIISLLEGEVKMKLWFRKISVVLVAIFTLGIYVPPTSLPNVESKASYEPSADETEKEHLLKVSEVADTSYHIYKEQSEKPVQQISIKEQLAEKAKQQALIKLGPRITHQLDNELTTEILPKLEAELDNIIQHVDEEHLTHFDITENPATGYGERIFNVYNHASKSNIAKFHVRRDYRPLEGYWFNFHYHLNDDQFEKHYHIADIYWDKNTPPKWMS